MLSKGCETGASDDVAAPAVSATVPRRRARRRWRWVLLAGGLLLAGGFLAPAGWAAWEERTARKALAEERFDEAQRHLDQALWVRQHWVPFASSSLRSTNVLAARIARLRGAYSEAEQYLSRCGQRNEMSDQVQLEWLLLRCERGEVDELAPGLLGLVDRGHPESAVILEALAGKYMRQTRYLEALHCLDRWAERDANCVRALHWRGWVSNQLDHRGQAISDYERVLELQPGRSVVRLALADILIESSRHPEALPHLERLREEQPANPEVLVALARCKMAQSRTDEARALLDGVLATYPDHFDALHQRGKLELMENDFALAERWLRKALERSPRDPEARYTLCLSLQGQPNREEEAQKELARWKQERRTRERLMRLLRTELNSKPNDPDLAQETGELFLQMGEDEKGRFWLYRALALDPRHAPSHRALAAYYERTNNKAKALEHRQQLTAPGAEK
jgi:tetratricopeptide (TPR) repeat protein